MNKIINGKKYDTTTAQEVAVDSYSNSRDFNYWREALHKKKTGEFFLHGEGGPMSKYSEHIDGNTWGYGEKIIPLTYEEAQAWAQKHCDGDRYESIFGAVEEDETRERVNLNMPHDLIEKIKRTAARENKSASKLIEDVMVEWLEK